VRSRRSLTSWLDNSVLLGYNTNGFAHHRLEDALHILADLGYQSVAITLDYHALNPFDENLAVQLSSAKKIMHQRGLRCVIETGARFLLDPLHKHQPTLVSATPEGRERRLDFLRRSVDIARKLAADAVSFWSGTVLDGAVEAVWMDRLADGCLRLCAYAKSAGVRLAFEPEPGMAVDTMDRFATLQSRVSQPNFGLTLDMGHLHCQGEGPIAEQLRRWRDVLWNIHIEDMRKGVHDHRMFGEGEIDFAPVLAALKEIGYAGGVHVELSRHSHDAVETARRSLAYLRARL
jgi:sugar phosphate isomerase/epimerase